MHVHPHEIRAGRRPPVPGGLRRYGQKFSPKVYTQPQLFACLVLKVFFKTDYRGVTVLLEEWPELAGALGLGLGRVPHWTTLQKAGRRLLTCAAPTAC